MSQLIKSGLLVVSVVFVMIISMASANAGVISTDEVINQQDRTTLIEMLEREDVQQELIELGVDPAEAIDRANQMTDEEIASLSGQISELPAGAGIGTLELLLIIIILILLI